MTPMKQLDIEVTYDDEGRIKVCSEKNWENPSIEKLSGGFEFTVLPESVKGCNPPMEPPRTVRCPPPSVFIELGWDDRGVLVVIDVRRGAGEGRRSIDLPGQRSTDRHPDADS